MQRLVFHTLTLQNTKSISSWTRTQSYYNNRASYWDVQSIAVTMWSSLVILLSIVHVLAFTLAAPSPKCRNPIIRKEWYVSRKRSRDELAGWKLLQALSEQKWQAALPLFGTMCFAEASPYSPECSSRRSFKIRRPRCNAHQPNDVDTLCCT